MNWILAVNILILVTILTQFCVIFLFIRSLIRNFKEFTTSPGADQPSPLSRVCDSLSMRFAKCMAVEVKTTMMGMLSGQARGETAEARDLAEAELAITNPALGGVIGMLPTKMKNKIFKNPALANAIISKLSGAGGRASPVAAADNGHNIPKFNL